jgi:UDP:flavonoid glycosyltransferase YjiC (YdhE family)
MLFTSNVDAATLRRAVERVLHTPRFKRGARQLGREFRADSPAYAADIIEHHLNLSRQRAA